VYRKEDLDHTRSILLISDWKRILHYGFEGMCEKDLKELSFHRVQQPLNEEVRNVMFFQFLKKKKEPFKNF
jgi:hypothetical protein